MAATGTVTLPDFPLLSGTRPGHWIPDCLGKYQMCGANVPPLPLCIHKNCYNNNTILFQKKVLSGLAN